MSQIVNSCNRHEHLYAIDQMHRDRKRVFVDILKWDIACDGPHERDQFDDGDAEYIIVQDKNTDHHLGSMRLLLTEKPHILGSLFAELCEGPVPSGPTIREVTRLCLSPRLRARDRRLVRDQLFTSLVQYGLLTGITGYTGVADVAWFSQLLALGWRCTPLGLPQRVNGAMVGALIAHVEPNTIELFRQAGTYASSELRMAERQLAAA